ncbi:membrane protein [Planctomycetales bacterium]|nr:membrane protein [Planctomycetales bacterium]
MNKTKRHWAFAAMIFAAKAAILLAVLGWVGWELYKSWNKISQLNWQPDYFYLTLCGVFYIAAFVPSVFFWRYVMQTFGQSPGLYESFRAYYIGHLGKYVPGKALAVVLRAGLLDSAKTKPAVAATAVFLETLTMMSAGACIAALFVAVLLRNVHYGNYLSLLCIGLMLVSALPIVPRFFKLIAAKILPKEQAQSLQLTFKTLFIGWLLMIPLWLMLGLSVWAALRGIGIDVSLAELPRFIAAAAFSIVLGFITMVPGGLGVREFALAQILVFYFATVPGIMEPTLAAITVAGVQRLVSIIAELVVSAMLCYNKR